MREVALKPSVNSLSEAFGPRVVKGDGIEVEFRDSKNHVRSGESASTPAQQALANTASATALQVGDVIQDGPNKGWVYCETKDGEPFLVAQSNADTEYCQNGWHMAMDLAAREKAELPTCEQLDAMYHARNTGGLRGTFNVNGIPGGRYWSAQRSTHYGPWSRTFRAARLPFNAKSPEATIRLVRKY